MSKYNPLSEYLRVQPGSALTLSFDDIERIIEAPLPPSAHNYRAWWANDRTGAHPYATLWLEVGWRVDTVSLGDQWVRFSKG